MSYMLKKVRSVEQQRNNYGHHDGDEEKINVSSAGVIFT